MKLKEDYIITSLIFLILILIWSKNLVSGYAPGQANSPATAPVIVNVGNDLNIANWMASGPSGLNSINDNGAACLGVSGQDTKLGPGDLNRQGWALTTAPTALGNFSPSTPAVNGSTNIKFAGFRKQLQAGGGGSVWYLFSYTGLFPTLAAFAQDRKSETLVTVGTFSIPQFVVYAASTVSPFPDGGCAYRVTESAVCSQKDCGSQGTIVQTLVLTKKAIGDGPCIAPDGQTDLKAITAAGGPTVAAVTGTNATQELRAIGAATSNNTSISALSGGGAFNTSASENTTKCYYAAQCLPSGCSGASAGFFNNSGTVITIAGAGQAQGILIGGGTGTNGQDGIGTAGSLIMNQPGASFNSPSFIAAGGAGSTTANVIVSGGISGTTWTLRHLFKEVADSPPLWQVATIIFTGATSGTWAGLAMDRVTPATGCVYASDNANRNIYKVSAWGATPSVATMTLPTNYSPVGIYLDASSTTPTGSYLYVLATNSSGTTHVFVIPVASVSAGTYVVSSGMLISGLGSTSSVTAAQIHVTNNFIYFTDTNAAHTKIWRFTNPTYAIGTTVNVTPTSTSGGSATTTGAVATATATGDITPAAAGTKTGQMTSDSNGNLYIANTGNNTISKVDTGGNITQFAGGQVAQGTAGTSGKEDSGASITAGQTFPGGGARFNGPQGICVSPDGITMFVADTGNFNIRIIT